MPGSFNFDRARKLPNYHAEKMQYKSRRLGYHLRSARSQYAFIPGLTSTSSNTAFIPGDPLNQTAGSGGVVKYPTTYEPDPDAVISPKPPINSPNTNTYGLKVYEDDDASIGVPLDPNDLQVQYDGGTPLSVTPFGSTTLAETNKLCYPTELTLNTAFEYTVILPESNSFYKYELLVNQPVYDLADGTVAVNTVGRETTFTITPTAGGKIFDIQYTYVQRGPVRNIQFSFYKCFLSANPSSNFLSPNSCLNKMLDKTGENIDLAYATKEDTYAAGTAPHTMMADSWESTLASLDRNGIHWRDTIDGGRTVFITKGDNNSRVSFYLPIYIKDTNPNVRIYYSTDYGELNNGATSMTDRSNLSGSPQLWEWELCHDGGTISSPLNGTYPINRSDIISRDLLSERPELANLKGLYYIKVKAAVPNLSSTTQPRSVEFDFLQCPLPTGWYYIRNGMNSGIMTVTGSVSGLITPGSSYTLPAGEVFTIEATLINNVPYDYGRSATVSLSGVQVDFNWNNDLTVDDPADWKVLKTNHSASLTPYANIMIPREMYDVTNNKIVFRVRKNAFSSCTLRGITYLRT